MPLSRIASIWASASFAAFILLTTVSFASMASSTKIFQVDAVVIGLHRIAEKLSLCVSATSRTPGFTNVQLEPAEKPTPDDGIYQFVLSGIPPSGSVMQALTSITITHTLNGYPADLKAIRVIAETNVIEAKLGEDARDCVTETADSGVSSASNSLVNASWLAEDIKGRGVVGRLQSNIEFLANGRVAGFAGCNRMAGSYSLDGSKLTLSPLASTRMMCPPAIMDQEKKFLAALGEVQSYRISGSILVLTDTSGQDIMRLIRTDS